MARRFPSLNALRAFEAAARHGRMTLAAAEMNVTHGAVSRQVRHLEEVLGVPLFEGPKNQPRLTEAGRALLPGLSEAFDLIERSVRLIADSEEGPLDVSCLGTFTMRWLIPRLHRFQAARPGIQVRLSASDGPVDFARGGFDLAIRVGRGPWPEEAVVAPLFAETFGVVMAPRWVDRALPALKGVPLLRSSTRPRVWTAWAERACVGVEGEQGTEFEHFYFMLEAATAGMGACVAPWHLVIEDMRAGRLVAPFGFVASGLEYVALRPRRRHRKAAVFVDWLVEEAGRTPVSEEMLSP